MYFYVASSSRANSRKTQLLSLFFFFFLSFFTQEVAYAALNGRLLFWKKKETKNQTWSSTQNSIVYPNATFI